MLGLRLLSHLPRQGLVRASRAACTAAENGGKTAGQGPQRPPFDAGLLEILVCPLSKKPLSWFRRLMVFLQMAPQKSLSRYNESTNELINEELGIAYPIIDGIPNMIPQAARMIGKEKQEMEPEQT